MDAEEYETEAEAIAEKIADNDELAIDEADKPLVSDVLRHALPLLELRGWNPPEDGTDVVEPAGPHGGGDPPDDWP